MEASRAEIEEEIASLDTRRNDTEDVAEDSAANAKSECPTSPRNASKERMLEEKHLNIVTESGKCRGNWKDRIIGKIQIYLTEIEGLPINTRTCRNRKKFWNDIRERIKCHPEEAKEAADLPMCGIRNESGESTPSLLHVLIVRAYNFYFPIQIFDELIRAYPAAVFCQSKKITTPLAYLLERYANVSPESDVGQKARLLLERMFTLTSTDIANAIGSMPVDIVEKHIRPYLGHAVAELDSDGFNILTVLLRRREYHHFQTDDMIHRILDAVPISASTIPTFPEQKPKGGFFPLHLACLDPCPLDIIKKLVGAYPDALTLKSTEHGWTPLHIMCGSRAEFFLLFYFIQAYPQALLMYDEAGYAPLHRAFYIGRRCKIDAACIRLISRLCPQALSLPTRLDGGGDGDLPLHIACKNSLFKWSDEYLSVDIFATLVDCYREAITIMPRTTNGWTSRQLVEHSEHPDKNEILRVFDSA